MTDLIKGENLDIETDTHRGSMECGNESRDQGDGIYTQKNDQDCQQTIRSKERGMDQIFPQSHQKEPTLLTN